jgi:membrane fusion protein, heavy metal efflux system
MNNDTIDKSDEHPSPHRVTRPRNLLIVASVAMVALIGLVLIFWRGRQTTETTPPAKSETKIEQTTNEVSMPPEALAAAGIEIVGVTVRPAVALLSVAGTVQANQQQTQQVTPLVGGRIERVLVALGDRVRAGSVLATIASPQIAELRGNLRAAETKLLLAERNLVRVQRSENRSAVLQAKAKLDESEATLRRTKRLVELGVGAGKDLIAAEAAYKTAKAEYDFQNNIALNREVQQAQADVETARTEVNQLRQSLNALGATAQAGNASLISVRAPVSGSVIERLVNAGAGIEAGKPLFTIANLLSVWVIANVPEAQVGNLHPGTPAEIHSAALGSQVLNGHVNYIDPQLNEETRTARVRVEVGNAGERLKVGMFVNVAFQAATTVAPSEELVVPSEAVQRIADRTVVFVPKAGEPGHFEVRNVEVGGETQGYQRVLSGLKLGDHVVTKGSFNLKSLLMKGQFGEEEEEEKKKP